MTKQKKIAVQEVYETPLEVLLLFLRLPHKIYRDIYLEIIERRLSSKPLIQCEETIAYLAEEVNIEPGLMTEKIKNLVKMKWVEYEQVGDRDTNQIFVISPQWRYKHGIDKNKFGIALKEYKLSIKDDKAHTMTTKEIYELMNSICLHTREVVDRELCKLGRFKECNACSHKSNKCNSKCIDLYRKDKNV